MRVQSDTFLESFLTNKELNRLGTRETAKTGQRCGLPDISAESNYRNTTWRGWRGVEQAIINQNLGVLSGGRRMKGTAVAESGPSCPSPVHGT